MPPRTARAAVASPARSTRSARGRGADDDWDGESVASSQAPPSRKNGNANNSLIGLKDTSVNIAAAFHAAQTGAALPTPPVDRAFPKHRPAAKRAPAAAAAAAAARQAQRATSPAEQLASAARALSPVRFFLRPGSVDESGEYASFASVGNGDAVGGAGAGSAETSYSYEAEDAYVRAAQREHDARRRAKGRKSTEDRPYRPAEDDVVYDSDSGGDGEGVVRAGALDGRAGTRGKRADKGEGYLGMGLGLQPRARRSRRSGGGGASFEDGEGDDEEREEVEEYHHRGYSPLIDDARPNGAYRSPTPAQLLRALTPQPLSPRPSKRRQPSPLRTVVTNLAHGVALALRFLVELVPALLDRVIARPAKAALRAARTDWKRWLVGLAALGLAIRLARGTLPGIDAPGRFSAPHAPPGTMDELVARLASIEHALSALSAEAKSLGSAQSADRRRAESTAATIGDLSSQLDKARSSLSVKTDSAASGLHDLRAEVGRVAAQVGKHGASLAGLSTVGADVAALSARVATVERDVQAALDDDRLGSALARLLPAYLPVRTNDRGTTELDPAFWAELRRVFVGHGEVESAVRRLVGAGVATPQDAGWSIDAHEQELEDWAGRLFARRLPDGAFVSRADFIRILEGEVAGLRAEIAAVPRTGGAAGAPPIPAAPGVTIKTAKGEDVTAALQALVDAALLRYSKDVLARPDYALFTAGARVVPSITSDTLLLSAPASRLSRLVSGARDAVGRPPATALHPDTSVGSCWPFAGGRGQLGIALARPARVDAVTLEHAAHELALDTATAPRDVEVWALVADADVARVAAFLDAEAEAEAAAAGAGGFVREEGARAHSEHGADDGGASVRLARFTYDPRAPHPIQTFPVDAAVRALQLETAVVVVKVGSNWGGDLTCLYRVRVHGETA